MSKKRISKENNIVEASFVEKSKNDNLEEIVVDNQTNGGETVGNSLEALEALKQQLEAKLQECLQTHKELGSSVLNLLTGYLNSEPSALNKTNEEKDKLINSMFDYVEVLTVNLNRRYNNARNSILEEFSRH